MQGFDNRQTHPSKSDPPSQTVRVIVIHGHARRGASIGGCHDRDTFPNAFVHDSNAH